jgi:hypothetical protein
VGLLLGRRGVLGCMMMMRGFWIEFGFGFGLMGWDVEGLCVD